MMSSSAPLLSPGVSLSPADLDRTQRVVLIGAVLLVHMALAGALWVTNEPVAVLPSSPAIEVSLIADEPAAEVSAPVKPPTPPAPRTPPRQPVASARAPAEPQPQVVASTAAAQPTEMVVPPAPADTQPAPTVVEPLPQPSIAAPVAQVAAAMPPVARATPQPIVLPSSAVRYLYKPPLVFPRVSLELGESGVVELSLEIDERGYLRSIKVTKTSGYSRLDRQAEAYLRQARFQPWIENGVPRAVTVTTTIGFNLKEE